mgnify:CR=1 FL=1
MKRITERELKNILYKHERWLMECEDGVKADLKVDLSGADLRGTDLSNSNMFMAELVKTDLRGADLTGANLEFADLSLSKIEGAEMTDVNLDYAEMD